MISHHLNAPAGISPPPVSTVVGTGVRGGTEVIAEEVTEVTGLTEMINIKGKVSTPQVSTVMWSGVSQQTEVIIGK